MTLAECGALKKGDKVKISEGRGWFREGTFLKMMEVTTYGTVTLADFMRKDFDLGTGRKKMEMVVEIVEDNGRTKKINVNPRRVTI